MATRKTPAPPPPAKAELTVGRDEAKSKLQERINKGRELKQRPASTREQYDELSKEFDKWDRFNTQLLETLFTSEQMSSEYARVPSLGVISFHTPSLGEQISSLYDRIDNKAHRLDSIIERLELVQLAQAAQQSAEQAPASSGHPRNKKVFIVHGRDDVAKTNLEVFLREIGLEPVVLHRQADQGLTIIEKFEKHSDVGYAFILLTPDEVAYLHSEEGKPDNERQKELRARPNVLFEFGYFVGKLGRSRVCCLYTGGVVVPSDLNGLVYKSYQSRIEEVAYDILKDLKVSGYAIGM